MFFLNKDEVSDSIQLLNLQVHSFHIPLNFRDKVLPRKRYKFKYYFKAMKVTNEAKILKFHSKPTGKKAFKNYIIKVNVY